MGDFVSFVAGTTLYVFVSIVVFYGVVSAIQMVVGRGPTAKGLAAASEVTVRPATEAELAIAQGLVTKARETLEKRTARDDLPLGLWKATALALALALIPLFISVGEYWRFGAYLAIACLPVFIPWLALETRRRYRRSRRMRDAHVVPGVLQTLAAEYAPGGESSLDYYVWLGCAFHTPTGQARSVRYRVMVEADPDHPKCAKWLGAPETPAAFVNCPSVGERVPVAVLFVDDCLYEILGPHSTSVTVS